MFSKFHALKTGHLCLIKWPKCSLVTLFGVRVNRMPDIGEWKQDASVLCVPLGIWWATVRDKIHENHETDGPWASKEGSSNALLKRTLNLTRS